MGADAVTSYVVVDGGVADVVVAGGDDDADDDYYDGEHVAKSHPFVSNQFENRTNNRHDVWNANCRRYWNRCYHAESS